MLELNHHSPNGKNSLKEQEKWSAEDFEVLLSRYDLFTQKCAKKCQVVKDLLASGPSSDVTEFKKILLKCDENDMTWFCALRCPIVKSLRVGDPYLEVNAFDRMIPKLDASLIRCAERCPVVKAFLVDSSIQGIGGCDA